MASMDATPTAVRPSPPTDVVLSATLLADEAVRQGATLQWIHRACFIASIDGRQAGFRCARTDLVSSVAEHLTQRKDLTHEVLGRAGLPTIATRSYPAADLDAAEQQFVPGSDHVVKPAQGRQGRGVTVGVSTTDELAAAWAAAVTVGATWLLVQPAITGREIRFLVVDGDVAAVAEKRPTTVVGDGYRTLRELLDAGNQERRTNPYLADHPLTITTADRRQSSQSACDEATVLADGERLTLSRKASISEGGTSHDLTGQVHPALERLALDAVRCIPGLGIAGVDLIVPDPAESAGATVLEINSMPGLGMHHFPATGTPRAVAERIVEATLAAARPPRDRRR